MANASVGEGRRATAADTSRHHEVAPESWGDLGTPLAEGRTAQIFAWGEGRVIKRFRPWVRPEDVLAELDHSQAVANLGLPVPQVGGLVERAGALAIAFERIDGGTMLEASAGKPRRFARLGADLGRLHARLHEAAVGASVAFPELRERLREKVSRARSLPEHLRHRFLARLDRLPAGDRLCHGDFHPENVLSAEDRRVIIDWVDAAVGDPLADVARTVVLIEGGPLPERWMDRVRIRRRRAAFLRGYLRTYFRCSARPRSELDGWLPLVAAARLSEVDGTHAEALLGYLAGA